MGTAASRSERSGRGARSDTESHSRGGSAGSSSDNNYSVSSADEADRASPNTDNAPRQGRSSGNENARTNLRHRTKSLTNHNSHGISNSNLNDSNRNANSSGGNNNNNGNSKHADEVARQSSSVLGRALRGGRGRLANVEENIELGEEDEREGNLVRAKPHRRSKSPVATENPGTKHQSDGKLQRNKRGSKPASRTVKARHKSPSAEGPAMVPSVLSQGFEDSVVSAFFDARAYAVVVVFRRRIEVHALASVASPAAKQQHKSGRFGAAVVFAVGSSSDGGSLLTKLELPSTCTAAQFVDGGDGFLASRHVVERVPAKRRRELEDSLPWLLCACAWSAALGPAAWDDSAERSTVPVSRSDAALRNGQILVLRAADLQLLLLLSSDFSPRVTSPAAADDDRDRPSQIPKSKPGGKKPRMSYSRLHKFAVENAADSESVVDFPTPMPPAVTCMTWAPDSRVLVGFEDGSLAVFSLPSGLVLCDSAPREARPISIAFDMHLQRAVVGYSDNVARILRVPKVWDLRERTDDVQITTLAHMRGHQGEVHSVVVALAMPPDEPVSSLGKNSSSRRPQRVVITGSKDGTVRIWPSYFAATEKGPANITEICGYQFWAEVLCYDVMRAILLAGDKYGSISVCQVRRTFEHSKSKEASSGVAVHVIHRLGAHLNGLESMSFCSFTDVTVTSALASSSKKKKASKKDATIPVIGVWPEITGISHAAAVSEMADRPAPSAGRPKAKRRPVEVLENDVTKIEDVDVQKLHRVVAARQLMARVLSPLLPLDDVLNPATLDAQKRRLFISRGFARVLTNLQLEVDLITISAQNQARVAGAVTPEADALAIILRRQLHELRGLIGPQVKVPAHLRLTPNGIRAVMKRHRILSRFLVRDAMARFRKLLDTALPLIATRASQRSDGEVSVRQYRIGASFAHSFGTGVYRGLTVQRSRPVAIKTYPRGVHLETALDHDGLVRVLDVIEGPALTTLAACERAYTNACKLRRLRGLSPTDMSFDKTPAFDDDSDDDSDDLNNDDARDGAARRADTCYVVMPMLREDLDSFIERQPGEYMRPRTVASIIFNLLRAVSFLHSQRMVVRDLRPQQILMTSDGRPQIAHFGVMRALLGTCDSEPSENGWSFAAPELFARAVKGSSDVWSLGVLLAYCLHSASDRKSRPLFSGDTPKEILSSQVAFTGAPDAEELSAMADDCKFAEDGTDLLDFVGTQNWPLRSSAVKRDAASSAMPVASPASLDLMCEMLQFPTQSRISAVDALQHMFFQQHGLVPSTMERDQRPLTDIMTDMDTTDMGATATHSTLWSARGFTRLSHDVATAESRPADSTRSAAEVPPGLEPGVDISSDADESSFEEFQEVQTQAASSVGLFERQQADDVDDSATVLTDQLSDMTKPLQQEIGSSRNSSSTGSPSTSSEEETWSTAPRKTTRSFRSAISHSVADSGTGSEMSVYG